MIALGLGFHGYPAIDGDDYPPPLFFVPEDYQRGGRGIPLPTLGNQETRFAIRDYTLLVRLGRLCLQGVREQGSDLELLVVGGVSERAFTRQHPIGTKASTPAAVVP